jgi:hypothetical protein
MNWYLGKTSYAVHRIYQYKITFFYKVIINPLKLFQILSKQRRLRSAKLCFAARVAYRNCKEFPNF